MSTASALEWQMLDLINQERTSRGLDPLRLELNLNESAEDHSSWMLQTDTFSHTGSGGSSAGQRMASAGFDFSNGWGWGENIALQSERGAAGYADDVINLHNNLMNSSGHRANILNPNYEVIGIGIEVGNYNGWTAVVVTQNFAYTGGTVDLDGGSGSGSGGGGGGGSSPAPTPPAPAPQPPAPAPAGTPAVVKADTVVLAPGSWERLADTLRVIDPDGDRPIEYVIRDKSGWFDFYLDGEILSPKGGAFRIDGGDIGRLYIQTDVQGARKQLLIRAEDEDGRGPWEQFNAISTPKGDRPLLAVENMVFSEDRNRAENLEDHLSMVDRTNDSILWYELLDTSGRDNFIFNGRLVDASTPYRVAASDIDDVWVRGEASESKTIVKIRAFDGGRESAWEPFTLHTLNADDPLLIV